MREYEVIVTTFRCRSDDRLCMAGVDGLEEAVPVEVVQLSVDAFREPLLDALCTERRCVRTESLEAGASAGMVALSEVMSPRFMSGSLMSRTSGSSAGAGSTGKLAGNAGGNFNEFRLFIIGCEFTWSEKLVGAGLL